MLSDSYDETGARCPLSLPAARVHDDEQVALLAVHAGSAAEGQALKYQTCDASGNITESAFSYSAMTLRSTNNESFPHNKCGQSEGTSLSRRSHARDEDILRMCEVIAAKKGMVPFGAGLARVGDLRSISLDDTEGPLMFVLADGCEGNEYHAVLRLRSNIIRPLHAKLREQLINIFNANRMPTRSSA